MFSYESLENLVLGFIYDGELISMPVPQRDRDGSLIDCFFVYSADSQTWIPNEPSQCVVASPEKGTCEYRDCEELFRGIDFDPRNDAVPEDIDALYAEAESLYGAVREEFAKGVVGKASRRYASLIEQISFACLMPYYRALSPELFSADGQA